MKSTFTHHWLAQLVPLFFSLVFFMPLWGQFPSANNDDELAWLVEADKAVTEIDTTYFAGSHLGKKWDANTVTSAMLLETGVLSSFQVEQFFIYKMSMGNLKDLYELQAIPGWDPDVVRKMFSYLRIGSDNLLQLLKDANRQPTTRITLRWRGIGSKKYTPSDWLGSALGLQLNYSYRTPSLQVGLLSEKDPGEKWFDKKLYTGIDFLSFHALLQPKGIVKTIIIGDYTVNMGQGLLQWQTFALKKTPLIASLKKTGVVFRPYRSAGEYNFHRGVAISLQKKQHGLNWFVSSRLLSANLGYSALDHQWGVTSLITNGYHRTFSEISKRNNFQSWTTGVRYSYSNKRISGGINAISYFFSLPLVITEKPYDRFSINDKQWWNASIDVTYRKNNWHIFLEQAIDKRRAVAGIYAVLLSLSRQLDLAIVTRLYAKRYQSLFANSFSESSLPGNEQGIFLVANASLSSQLRLQLFQDVYRFPWLRYTINQPSMGAERFFQLQYLPNKAILVTVAVRMEQKLQNSSQVAAPGPLKTISTNTKRSWRVQWQQTLTPLSRYIIRLETVSYLQSAFPGLTSTGYLAFLEWHQRWGQKGLTTILRSQLFDTDNSESAIYVFLPSVAASYQLRQYTGRGCNFLFILENEVVKGVSASTLVSYEQRNTGEASPLAISLQIAVKLH